MTKSNLLVHQPYFIQYAYLDLKNECECNDFLEDVKKPAKQAFETYFPELRDLKQFEPRLFARTNWQEEIRDFLDAWYKGNIVAKEKDKWLNEQLPYREVHGDNISEIGKETFVIGLINLDLMGFLAVEMSETLKSGAELKKCAEGDCNRYFVLSKRGIAQRYCSPACKQKAYRLRQKNS